MPGSDTAGCLFIVATPIGCLEDITMRALRVLKEADTILAEDTRHSKKLCTHYGISTRLQSFHAHTTETKIDRSVDRLLAGARLALITDAGTPLVSDPGARLVRRAIDKGVTIEAIPGPSAVITALCVAGLAPQPFRFEGFVARSGSKRRDALARVASECGTSVVFESAERLSKTLADLEAVVGSDREVAVCRELTKRHEEVIRGTISDVRSRLGTKLRGEITLVVQGGEPPLAKAPSPEMIRGWVEGWAAQGMSTRQMATALAQKSGLSRNEAYQAVLTYRTD